MNWRLSEAEKQAYGEDGFFGRASVFAPHEIEPLREAMEDVVTRAHEAVRSAGHSYEIDGNRYVEAAESTIQYEHSPGSQTIRVVEPFHHLEPRLNALIDDPRVVEPMRGILGCEQISLWTEKLNFKRPREGSCFRRNQDSPYWAHAYDDPSRLPNVMLLLDTASEENGCFRVIRGSHKKGMLPGLKGDGELGPLFTDPEYFDESQSVAARLPAGSLFFFSPDIVHGSEPNRSDLARRALVITYQAGAHRMFKVDAKRIAGAARAHG